MTLVAAGASLALAVVDGLAFGTLNAAFDLGFVAITVWAALAVRRRDFFRAGVLPPFLMLGLFIVIGIVHRGWIGAANDSLIQAVVTGLARHSGGLFAADVNALLVLAIRGRVLANRADQRARRESPYAVHSNRAGSPRPTLATTGVPSE